MPITQDRLINLIETTDEALSWCKSIRGVIDADVDIVFAAANAALGSNDIKRLELALELAKTLLVKLLDATSDKAFPWHLIERLAEERAHFRLTRRRNEIRKTEAQARRERLKSQFSAEIDAAMAQKLRQVAKPPGQEPNGTDLTPPPPIEVGKPVF